MASEDHALLGASSNKKWLTCTPSARLEAEIPDESSDEASEGTKCHDLMEHQAKYEYHGVPIPEEINTVEKRRAAGYTDEMVEAVRVFMDEAKKITDPLKAKGVPFTVLIEQKVDFSPWVPEGFGTGDLIVVAGQCVWVRDLKYGKGVRVESEENGQMMLYGLGAYNELSFAYEGIRELDLGIVQPRIGNVASWRVSLDNLLAWGDLIKPIAEKAWRGEGDFVPGPHCDDCFCRARRTCLARAVAVLTAARDAGNKLLTEAEVDVLLPLLDWVTSWANGIKANALDLAINGVAKYPNFKLVEGRSNRFLPDDNKGTAAVRLVANGIPKEKIFTEPQLLGITALQELVGTKKKFDELLGDLLIKPAGKPTLVPITDKRAEWKPKASADDDFGD